MKILLTPLALTDILRPQGLIYCLLLISACNWVDSTGVQNTANAGGIVGTVPVDVDETQIRIVALVEDTTSQILPVIGQGSLQRDPAGLEINPNLSHDMALAMDWNWGAPYQSGDLTKCNVVNEFGPNLAAPTLSAACADATNCTINFNFERDEKGQASFAVDLPTLAAPVGLAYKLTATDAEGNIEEEYLTLCAVSINEAPLAKDDIFDIIAGENRVVLGTDPINLLSNDKDDSDVRNQPLSVNDAAVVGPALSSVFELRSDGGFTYRTRDDLVISTDSPLFDSFIYEVTDGRNDSSARVLLRIHSDSRASNFPPVIDEIEDEFIRLGDAFSIKIDVVDPDRDTLSFSLSADTPAFVVVNTDTGEISGIGEETGAYTITLIASDAITETSASFLLVVTAPQTNRPPFADDISNWTVSGTFSYNVAGFFGDPDEDRLKFSAAGLPQNTQITEDGVIFGVASAVNRGRYIIRVFVNDGRGGTAADGFRLIVK